MVGQNGRIWIDGDPEDIMIAMGAIQMIADQAHVHGLTNNVKDFLQKAKGIDPEVEAEEERKAEEARRADQEKKRAEIEAKKAQRAEERIKREEKKKLEEEEDLDDEYDSLPTDDLCRDGESGGNGIVTILAPDGESLMVMDEEELPPCEEPSEEADKKRKEGQ